jgi:DNA repair exonuclease SbcCD ATPase subunit
MSRADLLVERAENLRDVAEMKQMMEESEATTAQYEQMYEEALELQAAAETRVETLLQQLQGQKKSGASSAADVKRTAVLESRIARFKSEAQNQAQRLMALEQTNDDLERSARAAIGDAQRSEDELAEAITENEVLQELMESRTDEHSEEIHRLRAQLESAGLAAAQSELERAKTELAEERDAVADLENQVSELSVDLDQSQETIIEVRAEAERELSAARAAFAAAQSAASAPAPPAPGGREFAEPSSGPVQVFSSVSGSPFTSSDDDNAEHDRLPHALSTLPLSLPVSPAHASRSEARGFDVAATRQRVLEVEKLLAVREAEAEQLRAAHARDTAQMEELTAHVEKMSADVLAKGKRVHALEAAERTSHAIGAAPRSDATAEQLRSEVLLLRRKLAKKSADAAAKEEKLTEEIEVLHRCVRRRPLRYRTVACSH